MPLRRIAMLTLLLGCEHAEPPVGPPSFAAPDAPELESMRSSTTANDPPPPAAAPIAPDLVGLPGTEKRWFLALDKHQRHAVRQICRARRADPCAGMMPRRENDDRPDPMRPLFAQLTREQIDGTDAFCFRANGRRGCATPLVVAFDAQPIEFLATARPFAFRPGEPLATDWPTAATPWIALDRDGDGAITNGLELFGDAGGAKNGFEALAALDDNRDGVIDRADAAFASLLLWADTNADRKSSPEELSRLSRVVVSIPLAHEIDARCTRGNCEGERGSMQWRDANGTRTGAVVDVYLRAR